MQASFFFQKIMVQAVCFIAVFGWMNLLSGQPVQPKNQPNHDGCGVRMTAEELAEYRTSMQQWRQKKASEQPEFNPPIIYVPVVFTIVRHPDGDGVTEDQVTAALGEANAKFASANIQFFECRPPEIVESEFWYNLTFQFSWPNFCGSNSAEHQFDEAYHIDDVINIYCVNTNGQSWAPYPSSKVTHCFDWIIYHQGHIETTWLLPHELGHYFALPHTFEGMDENVTRNPNNNCWNCEEKGDLFCDTPADYHDNDSLGWSEGCVADIAFDDCGVQLQPAGLNLMSYSNSACLAANKVFSAEQRARMYSVAGDERAYLHCTDECEATLDIVGNHWLNRTFRTTGLLTSIADVNPSVCVNYQSGDEVRLMPDFWAEAGCLFNALIAPCVDGATNPQPTTDRFSPEKPTEPAADFSMKAAPNPFTDELNLTILLTEKNTRLRARLLDLSGREVQILVDEMVEEPQLFSLKRSVGDLPPGVYFVDYQANATRGVLKIVRCE